MIETKKQVEQALNMILKDDTKGLITFFEYNINVVNVIIPAVISAIPSLKKTPVAPKINKELIKLLSLLLYHH